jgi:hypothetical protein
MNDDRSSREDLPNASEPQGSRVFGSDEQRRRLLRAVATSGALAGAGVPLTAQATTRPYCRKSGMTQNYHASASAVGSLIGSVTGTVPPKYGHTCSHYRNVGSWGTGYTNGRGRSLSYSLCADPGALTKLRFYLAFEFGSVPASTASTYRECADILANYSSSDEAIWLTAMFNANKCGSNFPYTPTQVIDLYNSKNPSLGGMVQSGLNLKAKELFRDYLSQSA